uniref:uncharacterized protein LOC122592700 n=1 Tax=Erigeron canadensis TaxID=72917 RepID=UPI001CB9D6E0|nr:uncharacterized protein LOC122592700 [Erigeron canadensis]
MKNQKFDEFDLLPVRSHEMGEIMFRPEFKIERIISKDVEEDEFEIERVVKFVEEYGVKESARGLRLSEEEVIKSVSEYIKNVTGRLQDLETMVDQESRQMPNKGKCGTEMQESHQKTSKEEGGDKSVHVQKMWTSKVVENREFVLLHTTKLVDIIGYREYELEQVIKVVQSMNIEYSGHILGLEYLDVVDKVTEYITLKKSRIEFLHNVVQESELMREKRGSAATNTNQEPQLDNSVSVAVFVSHQELLCNESDEKKEGEKSVCVNERKGETESGQESHLKTLNEEGEKSVDEPLSRISGGMSTAGMQIGGQEYPPLAGRSTGQKQLSVEESNESDGEPISGQKILNNEKEDGEFVRVDERIVKESESKSGQESHLKSLDEEKEEGDKSAAHGEVRDEKESRLLSGQMTLNEENEGGDNSVNHIEQKNENEVKSDSGQEMNEEKVSTESVNAEAGNEKGSEKVTGSGMLTVSREVGDSMQVAAGQQIQNDLKKEVPPVPAPAPVQGALAPYIDFALARPSKPKRRGQKVHNVVQESELMREKRGSAVTNTNQEPRLDNSVSLAVFVSHQELLFNELDGKKEGDKSVCVNERKGKTESGQKTSNDEKEDGKSVRVEKRTVKENESKSGQESHLKSLDEEREKGDKSVNHVEVRNERESVLESGQMMSHEESESGDKCVNHVEKIERDVKLESGQQMKKEKVSTETENVEVGNEKGEVTGSGMLTISREVGDSMQVAGQGNGRGSSRDQQLQQSVYDRVHAPLPGQTGQQRVTESEPKSGHGLHLKSLDEEKEEGDKSASAHVEVTNERESVLESGLMTLNEENEGGDNSVNHFEQKDESEVKSDSGQEMNEENVSTESVNAEAGNDKGSEEVTGSGMLTVSSREVGDSMQVAAGQGHESGSSSGQQQLQPSVNGWGWGRGYVSGQQPQNELTIEDPPAPATAPAPVQGALAPYIDFAFARPTRPNKRGQKVHK